MSQIQTKQKATASARPHVAYLPLGLTIALLADFVAVLQAVSAPHTLARIRLDGENSWLVAGLSMLAVFPLIAWGRASRFRITGVMVLAFSQAALLGVFVELGGQTFWSSPGPVIGIWIWGILGFCYLIARVVTR
ncbi:MAG: hypothetical protein JXQ73_25525 [Phycisphaerae bacterium]|nr:hypothetical protein [Phycisphaerae bacterium]